MAARRLCYHPRAQSASLRNLKDCGATVKPHPNLRLTLMTPEILCCAAAVIAVMGLLAPAARGGTAKDAKKVIIDTDPGTDDALALLLAFNSPELQVEAVTVVAGNVTADVGLDNALRIASLAGKCDIPIAKGAAGPLTQKLNTACDTLRGHS
jgi:Inosine-uridine preferring nucleoside hydrolase